MMLLLSGCVHQAELKTVNHVDLDRFMGLWYIHGYTPIFVDKEAYNGVEHYYGAEDGRILTTYQFRDGGFSGKLKSYTPTGFVFNAESNADWRMQFIWPFKAKYYVYGLSEDYQITVIAHPNRKNAWIMSRKPEISEVNYNHWLEELGQEGFDLRKIIRMPHDWSDEQERLRSFEETGNDSPLVER